MSTEDTPMAAPAAQSERIDLSNGIDIEPAFRAALHVSLNDLNAHLATLDEEEKKAHLKGQLDLLVKALDVLLPAAAVAFPVLAPFAPAALGGIEALVKAIEG